MARGSAPVWATHPARPSSADPGAKASPSAIGGQHAAVAVGAAALRVERVESLPAHDRAGRPGPAGEQPQHELAAEGVPGKVVVAQSQVIDEREPVVGEDVGRVARGSCGRPLSPWPRRSGRMTR